MTASPELLSVQAEYKGYVVPFVFPHFLAVQIEYKHVPLTSGPIQGGVVEPIIVLSTSANVPISSQIVPADLLAYPEVNENTTFDAESKWEFIVGQYSNRTTGDKVNIIHIKIGSIWKGYMTFYSNSPLGSWEKRTLIIHATTGEDLVLLPTRFMDGESLVLQA